LRHPELFQKLGIEPPAGILLYGPPGSGKTLLAKAVANESEANFILLNGPEIMNKFYGESERKVREIFEEAEKNSPSIIFIDEIDAIAPKREEVHGEVERRVVSQLLTMMDGLKSRGRVVVIGATNRPNAIDPALRRPGRFDREIQIGVPDKKARLEILKIHTRNMPLAKDVKLDELAQVTHGFVGADLSALAKEAAMNVLRKVLQNVQLRDKEPIPQEVLDKVLIEAKDFKDSLKIVRPSAMREVLIETPNIGWDDIGGLDEIKQQLKEAVEWPLKNPDAFKRLGIRPPRGILLYGPPGTGKTLLAKAVAKESEANFILVKGPTLLNMWVGESEKGLRQVFERARQTAPTIVFFDELDAIAPRRGFDTGSKVTERMVNTFLAEMDGLEEMNDVVIIGATNRPDIIDPALLRPGRFDRLVLTAPPDEKSRLEIFKIHTKTMPLAKDVRLEELAKKADGYSGSDIEAVCREAGMLALREDIKAKEVKKKFFENAMNTIRASIPKETMEKYKTIEDEYLKSAKSALQREKQNYFG
jgi:transitional endoplasmic reticulum ATPase